MSVRALGRETRPHREVLVQDFKAGYGIDLSTDKMALQRLRELSAEKAKIHTDRRVACPPFRGGIAGNPGDSLVLA